MVDALDLVFVIDTTASMGLVIHDLASMRSIVRVFERMVPSVRIGISAYKDHDIPLPPVITFPLTATDPYLPRIIGFIESIDASPVGSRSIDEDVHLGLEAATLMHWRLDAKQVLVLIGDAEAHPENQNETFWRVRNFVQGNKLRAFSTLFVTTASLSAGNIARAYFQALAEAANGTFNDHTGSMMESVLLSVITPIARAKGLCTTARWRSGADDRERVAVGAQMPSGKTGERRRSRERAARGWLGAQRRRRRSADPPGLRRHRTLRGLPRPRGSGGTRRCATG